MSECKTAIIEEAMKVKHTTKRERDKKQTKDINDGVREIEKKQN